MITKDQARGLLQRLDGEPADALESETFECMSWDPHRDARESQLRDLRERVVCFANASGGAILLGISDRKRTRREAIAGVGAVDPGELRVRVYDGTAPPILIDIEELLEPEGRLLLIRVPRGVPPHTTSEGMGKIRVGKECKPLTGSDWSRLLFAGGQRDLTSQFIPGARIEDLDPEQIKLLRRTMEAEASTRELVRQSDEELLENLGLVRGEDVTFAAILLLGRSAALIRWVPQHEVVFLRLRTATRYDVRHDLKGPLLTLLEDLRRILDTHLRISTVQTDGFGELTVPNLTWWAVREATLNALVHRDYFLRQTVQIALDPQRLEVTSPGGFVGGVTPQNILRHPPVRRNPFLAGALQTIGVVNRAGIGVDRIHDELLRLGKAMPRYDGDESHVRLVLPTATHQEFARFVARETRLGRTLDLDDLIVLRGVMERGYIDRRVAAERLQLPQASASERLISLRERGYLIAHGRGRGTAYRLSRALSDLLRGPEETDRDMPLDDEAVRLRVQAVLRERGRLANAEIRRFSGYSRVEVVRMMRSLAEEGWVRLRGRGRAAHYVPGPLLSRSEASGGRRSRAEAIRRRSTARR